MKKIIVLALTALMMVGCEPYVNPTKDFSSRFMTVYIDSCEWLMSQLDYDAIAHKGNCRFCKERRKQELKELLNIKGRYSN